MKVNFTKMQGLGNDFILIDSLKKRVEGLPAALKRLSDRRFGIGFDQALILLPSLKADFRMDIYNADGRKVEMCGNGIRCLARYIWSRGLSGKDTLEIETMGGIIRPERQGRLIRVDMGEPVLEGREIPVEMDGMVIDYPLLIDDISFRVTCVSMGNPHCVIKVDDLDNFPVSKYGPLIERHSFFPQGTNVEFINIINEKEIRMRVWERGSGETLACGTGACASFVAANLKAIVKKRVTVHLKGGDLKIEQSKRNSHIYMTGPAREVFTGTVEI